MNLLNEKVTHHVFGKGKIVNQNDTIITINFDTSVKKFVYPDAFREYIVLKDQSIANSLDEVISERIQEEAALAKEREEERERELREQERQQQLANFKIHESSQIAFWLDAEEEQESFEDWQAFTGEIKSGPNKGKPNRAVRIGPNSAALLTVRGEDQEESERRIIGLFIVDEMFINKDNEDGIVPAHKDYRLKLTDQEIESMLFWNYYKNKNSPERMTWNSGKYRYYDNIWTVQILQDLMAMREDEEGVKEVKDFLDYFTEINFIDPEQVPEANGSLKQ